LAATGGEDVYDGQTFAKVIVPPMVSAKKWTAYWEDESTPAKMGDVRKMILDAPGLPAGNSVIVTVYQHSERGREQTATDSVEMTADGVLGSLVNWFNADLVTFLASRTQWPNVSFQFVAEASGRSVSSSLLSYSDELDVTLVAGPTQTPLATKWPFVIHTPWGDQKGNLPDTGKILVSGLPPGGAVLITDTTRLTAGEKSA
jgi:hypothetical protein